MAEQLQTQKETFRPIEELLVEVKDAVQNHRHLVQGSEENIKDLRWKFDQVSAKMNQAIYNDQNNKIHQSCLDTVVVLLEILARS